MTYQGHNGLEVVLILLPLVIGGYAIIALVVSILGIIRARREAYETMHSDFVGLKKRVRAQLSKEKSDE